MSTAGRLSEDDIYRTSTQYRLWSFSPEQLAAQRRKTHELALTRAHQHASQTADRPQNGTSQPEYLTEREELRLVHRYCELIQTTADHLKWPSNIKPVAVQYLKRFYLSNSCMTYPPKEIYKTMLFLASKTEAYHLTVTKFAQSISADPEAILAPEYKIMQALRFTLDVRQPFRGLKGVLMELLNMAEGLVATVKGVEQRSERDVQEALKQLKPPPQDCRTPWKAPPDGTMGKKHFIDRIQASYATAKTLCDGPASLTDAYFLYTPSQILLAALHIADSPLAEFYLDTKLPLTLDSRPKILATIQACAALLASYNPKDSMGKEERAALEKKLDLCRDPTTKDLIKAHAAMKRNGAEDGKVDEHDAKRRKLEREKREKEDPFGPSLGNGKV
ncbi:Cyclin CCL1 [Fulvia fulva]|uniref:RNA polymerase II holoenzyme cyclin-like subunit n=1 Tax=Passalora fulva TaxID=5499 RepID=A0A9Q8PAT7_PASFU|nr:Cyclin CCL1 [Fulvia fulva]UJO19057.1 Cyclin CCL1 [Fulvia fulva]WPV31000.1 Cyclin CCL1 [Fulvia fulva]